ncbi:MAG: hypothetical protein IMZ57_03870 [Acidobacteria bacterium]|nr:hypothetical protein [Acidobacteriota bacterium]
MESRRDWASLRDGLKSGVDISEISLKFENRDQLNGWQIAILNLLFMDEQAASNKKSAEASLKLSEEIKSFSEKLVGWTKTLAILTGVLAGAAVLNLVILLFSK